MSRIAKIMMLGVVLAASASYFSGSSASAAEVTFSAEFMNDPKNIAIGKGLFQKQCARCHGQRAYPGKAPKLKPEKYKADFVYRRITKGFRGMPGWKRRYNKLQRKSLTAYIMSKGFTN